MMRMSYARYERDGSAAVETEGIRRLSARLAANRLLVQASTGNTSIKSGDTLWIKASGKWLADAANPEFLIPVALRRARACLHSGTTIPETESGGGLCASIETAMHAALPHAVVLHVHSVNAIAWAVRKDALQVLGERLQGIGWHWIPYTLSGAPLAERVQEAAFYDPTAKVFLLGNHGLVVCGDSCEGAERLLEDVEERLRVEPRAAVEVGKSAGVDRTPVDGFQWPECPCIHGLAGDALSRSILRGGVLYPCQALFLPTTVFAGERSLRTEADCVRERAGEREGAVLLDEDRVLCSVTMTDSQRELLFGLSHVVRRIYESDAVRYLSAGEVSEVMAGGGQYLTNAR